MMMPPPIPVPRATRTRKFSPRPAPNLASPHAVALPSFSTTTGSPTRCSTFSLIGSSRQARFGANSTVERVSSTKPAVPRPTADTSSYLPFRRSTTSAMVSAVSLGLVDGVGLRTFSRIVPRSSTTPAATFVPPTSTPMVRAMYPSSSSSAPAGACTALLDVGGAAARGGRPHIARFRTFRPLGPTRPRALRRLRRPVPARPAARRGAVPVTRPVERGHDVQRGGHERLPGLAQVAAHVAARLALDRDGPADRAVAALRGAGGDAGLLRDGLGPHVASVAARRAGA